LNLKPTSCGSPRRTQEKKGDGRKTGATLLSQRRQQGFGGGIGREGGRAEAEKKRGSREMIVKGR